MLGSLFGGGDEVSADLIRVSPEGEKRIDTVVGDASKSLGDYAKDINQGVANTSNNQESLTKQQQLYGQENNLGKAIRSRYQGLLQGNLERLKQSGDVDAFAIKSNRLQQAEQVAKARQQINMQNYQRQMQAFIANQQARSQALSSVFGLAGTVGGAIVGGPGGAAVGSQVGSMAGRNIAGQGGGSQYGGGSGGMVA